MSFAELLSVRDRRRLRAIVRGVHLKFLPAHMLTNFECDKLIDAFSAATVDALLRENVDAGRCD